MKLVLATRNPGKVRELSQLLSPLGYEVLSLEHFPGVPEVVEDGATFKDNAVKKATAVARHTGQLALADDSGLEVDYLGGAPGVRSARFAGEGHDDRANNEKLLRLLAGVPPEKRTARFRCVVAVATPEGKVLTTEGTCEGIIAEEPRGEGGFGYDPLFYVPSCGKTFAELEPEVKNRISHRGRALALMREILAGLRYELEG
ncbi:XTP/dITP diphosphatase [Desulfofundulus thermocisternus]|jgi:XTP/dITP diphosphohydrolase|uniref:XTP/dITP diphosphatase n=1 Tax=Desulfofundulus thermocisternus TaxID=42471 RepID=UPI00217DE088|nr:XTP/dITP diphosphatase [Desulfofundulus thermocisternus]MCS5695277.1 XTP/dITP diphosphatase [Desulfofundulus thermocisternus]